jgi:hypothetical protein
MEETFYMLYNKAGATPYATRKFAEAQLFKWHCSIKTCNCCWY